MAEVRLFGHGKENVLGHILGIGGSKAHAHSGYGLCYFAQKLGKGGAVFGAFAIRKESIRVHVLSQQGNFLKAFRL